MNSALAKSEFYWKTSLPAIETLMESLVMMIIICYNCNLSLDCNIVLETKTKNISSSNIKFAIRFFYQVKNKQRFCLVILHLWHIYWK